MTTKGCPIGAALLIGSAARKNRLCGAPVQIGKLTRPRTHRRKRGLARAKLGL